MSSSAPRVPLFSYTGAYTVSFSLLLYPNQTLIASALFLWIYPVPVANIYRSRVTTRRPCLMFVHALAPECVYNPHSPAR